MTWTSKQSLHLLTLRWERGPGLAPIFFWADARPALHWAVAQHRPENVTVLLEFGTNIDATTSDSLPETAMEIARRMHLSEETRIQAAYQEEGRSDNSERD